MDIKWLQTFVTVAQKGNLTRAADVLCLSQPAISGHIKALEDELELKLFMRHSRGMMLTQAGQSLLQKAEQALAATHQVMQHARTLRENTDEKLRIGTISEPTILRFKQTLEQLSLEYPNLHLTILQGISGDVIEWILEGRVDAGYVIGKPEDSRIVAIQLFDIILKIVAPATWSNLICNLDWAGIAQLPWITTPTKCSFNRLATRMFSRHKVRPQTIIEANQEHTLRDLVASGMGLTLLREDVAQEAQVAGEVSIWTPGVEIAHLYFVFLRNKADNPQLQTLLNIIHSIWNKSNTTYRD